MTAFIDEHRDGFGVEPICETLPVAPSTYYAARSRPPSPRAVDDAVLRDEIVRVWKDNYEVYGARKVWRQLRREGIGVGRDRVGRLMKQRGISGARRGGKKTRTTLPDETAPRPADLVERNFTATAPNQLWVCDLTYVWTLLGFCYVAFVIDVFSRRIVGWAIAAHLRTERAPGAIEMAIALRDERDPKLIHHSDRGSQYTAIRYSERLADAGITASVGSRGDSYDNALAESVIGLYKTELIAPRPPWAGPHELERETATYVHWYNERRLHGARGDVPPLEFEAAYRHRRDEPTDPMEHQ
jgi:putative transposase